MYRKQILAALAGYRVIWEGPKRCRLAGRVPFWMVYSPTGERIRYASNPGEAWFIAYCHLYDRIETWGEPVR